MAVIEDWRDVILGCATAKQMISFPDIPTEILAPRAIARLEVYLFPFCLSYIPDIHVAVLTVETKSPWISQSVDPNLVEAIVVIHKGLSFGIEYGFRRRHQSSISIQAGSVCSGRARAGHYEKRRHLAQYINIRRLQTQDGLRYVLCRVGRLEE